VLPILSHRLQWRSQATSSESRKSIKAKETSVSSARTDEVLKVIVANSTMIKAYKAAVPGNGQPFPDGSTIVKLQWKPKKSTEVPFVVDVPDVFTKAFVIEKDSKRFLKSAGGDTRCSTNEAASDQFTADPKSLSVAGTRAIRP
jgi:cytochrome P460